MCSSDVLTRVILYFSVVRGVERYEHASLAVSLLLEKNVNAEKTIILLFVVILWCYLITNSQNYMYIEKCFIINAILGS